MDESGEREMNCGTYDNRLISGSRNWKYRQRIEIALAQCKDDKSLFYTYYDLYGA